MESNTLEAFVVKRRKVLLPSLMGKYEGDVGWYSANKHIIKEILIEAKEETVNGYNLYGTEIPIIFVYPSLADMTNPNMRSCIGVETRKWASYKFMKLNCPDEEFHYNGKYITDEDVIAWLENEKNIESMKRVKEWAIQYGERCKKVLEAIEQQRIETARNQRYSRLTQEAEAAQKVKKMLDRRNELVSRYQH